MMHPRPSPIAASLYTLRDLNADVIIMHGPHGCCFRTGRLLESDGVRVVTTAMAENEAQYECVVNDIYAKAYKIVKNKVDAATTMLNSISKIISNNITYVFIFYCINLVMTSFDLGLNLYYGNKEKK